MSDHRCTGDDDTCATCSARIDAAEEARNGRPYGSSQRELDWMADGAAADMVYGREW